MEQLSFRQILRKERDMAGKWRVWVEVADGETMILKFQDNPTATKVKKEITKFIKNKLNTEENGTSNT